MANNKKDYSTDTRKYCNNRSMDGKPLKDGYVLAPFWIQDTYEFFDGEIIEENCTEYAFGEHKFHIGFIQVEEHKYADYMKFFWSEINRCLKTRRNGRCVIGYTDAGERIYCPTSERCKNCPNRGKLEKFNQHKHVVLCSLDKLVEEHHFDVEDPQCPSPEATVLKAEEPSEDDHYEIVIARLEKENPRFADIVRLSKERVPVAEISDKIGLKTSRTYDEISNAYNACCDILNLGYKKKPKK